MAVSKMHQPEAVAEATPRERRSSTVPLSPSQSPGRDGPSRADRCRLDDEDVGARRESRRAGGTVEEKPRRDHESQYRRRGDAGPPRRREATKSDHDRSRSDSAGKTKCPVCNQTVGGGVAGYESHCHSSKYHMCCQFYQRGLPWKQAQARAHKVWKSLAEDRQSCSRGFSAAPEPGEPVDLREAEPRSSRRSRTPQQKAKREKSKRRSRDKCKRRSRDKSQEPRSRDKSQRRRSRDKTAKEETSAASRPKPPQTGAEVEEKSSTKTKKRGSKQTLLRSTAPRMTRMTSHPRRRLRRTTHRLRAVTK